jgi:hypothetical protein
MRHRLGTPAAALAGLAASLVRRLRGSPHRRPRCPEAAQGGRAPPVTRGGPSRLRQRPTSPWTRTPRAAASMMARALPPQICTRMLELIGHHVVLASWRLRLHHQGVGVGGIAWSATEVDSKEE